MMKFYTVEEIAEILQLDIVTVRRYLSQGDMKGAKIGKSWRVTEEDLKEFIKERRN